MGPGIHASCDHSRVHAFAARAQSRELRHLRVSNTSNTISVAGSRAASKTLEFPIQTGWPDSRPAIRWRRVMTVSDFEAREQQLLDHRAPLWVERWRGSTGAITAVRFDSRIGLILFGGKLEDACAEWLKPWLTKAMDGQQQLHFIDQGDLEVPNTKVRDLYITKLKQRRADLARAHVFMGSNVLVRMITMAANVVFAGLGEFHNDRASFDRALAAALGESVELQQRKT